MSSSNKGEIRTNRRAPTQKDVAELAGVSVMAVSTVVTGNKTTVGVSEATRLRIQKAIDELHYRPNLFARSLRLQHTGTVGFYNGFGYINTADPFIRLLFDGIALSLQANDQDILLYNGVYKDRRGSLIERVLSQKIDAVIVLPTHEDTMLIEALKKKQIPSIIIAESIPGLKSITADDAGGSIELANYIVKKGHRHVLYRRSAIPLQFEARRFEAFRSVIEQSGGRVTACTANDGMDSVTSQEEELLGDRSGQERVTAIVCWRDHSAVRAIDYCLAKDIHVPDDIAVAGFDGIHYPGSSHDLTTVTAHWDIVAKTAPELINKMMKGEELPDNTIVASSLHIGTTA